MPLDLKAQKRNIEEINRSILEFRGTERLLRFGSDVSVIVYRYPRYRYGLDDDFCSEFYLFFYPTMNRVIVGYADRGSSFASYLFSTLKWQLSRFMKMKRRRQKELEFVRNVMIAENGLYTPPSEPTEIGERAPLNRVRDGAEEVLSNRILLYVLRFWYKISDDDVPRIARILGCEGEWLMGKIDQIRKRMGRQLEMKRKIEERRNVAFYRLSMAYGRLEELRQGELGYRGVLESREIGEKKRKLLKQIAVLKRVISNARMGISKLKLSPSHRVLSEILGIPKGTIDTSNYVLANNMDRYVAFWEKMQ